MRGRVCHVCSSHHLDGRVFSRACVTLASEGYDVHLIAVSEGVTPCKVQGVTVHPLPQISSSARRICRRDRIARYAASLSPDLYHVHEPELLGPVIRRACGKPIIYDVHESYLILIGQREWIPRALRKPAQLFWDKHERTLVGKCDAVIAATDAVGERYHSMGRPVVTIANFPELDVLDASLSRDRERKGVVFIGSLTPNRGIIQSIEALGILRMRGTDIRFAIAGSGSESFLERIKTVARNAGVMDLVTFHGQVSRARAIEIANQSSIGLVPHLPEDPQVIVGLPVKLLEFMSLGLPVVYSKAPLHTKISSHRPIGVGIDDVTPLAIAQAIQQLVENPLEAKLLGENGRKTIVESYNWVLEARKLLHLYASLLASAEKMSPEIELSTSRLLGEVHGHH